MFNELKKKQVFDNSDKLGYVYALLNQDEYIKIGITKNPYQRIKSLSNSNTGGSEIIRYYLTSPMYIYDTVERIMHSKFDKYRTTGEWFCGDTLHYEDVVNELKNLSNDRSFHIANTSRERLYNSKAGEVITFSA